MDGDANMNERRGVPATQISTLDEHVIVLGIETSCDETAAAVIEDGRTIHANVIASQAEIHSPFGGVVPEVASRQHLLTINAVVRKALEDAGTELRDLDTVAVTYGPGLAGSLLVGVNTAKALAYASGLPFIGVNHLEGHIYAAWLEDVDIDSEPGFPLLCLIVSGGHTDLVLMRGHGDFELIGRTRDDAAGEAFDKGARVLGLGYPGGPPIQKAAEESSGGEDPFPRPRVEGGFDFSFSGLKTALLERARSRGMYPAPDDGLDRSTVSAMADAYQEAIVDSLVTVTVRAVEATGVNGLVLCGGVAANAALRAKMQDRCQVPVIVPRPLLCTDNGAMIGAAAHYRLRDGHITEWDLDILPGLGIGD